MKPLRAKYENGVLKLLEPLYVEEGAEVIVSVEPVPKKAPEGKPAPKQGLVAIVERARERYKNIPPEELENIPTDLAKNHKHYLYGHPKEEE